LTTVVADNCRTYSDSDTVSVDLAEPASANVTAPEIVITHPPVVVPPAVVLPPPPPVVDSDSESEMAESQSNTQFAPPQKFKGLINENAKDWIKQLENYCQCKEFNEDKKMALFKVLLVDSAAIWYDSLTADKQILGHM